MVNANNEINCLSTLQAKYKKILTASGKIKPQKTQTTPNFFFLIFIINIYIQNMCVEKPVLGFSWN